ncbi:aprataxin and PNK-like factor isoform X2 [Oryzias latipes]|uniref:aprataxin and PNK-like factor isoform X2 n=1 Tax=Oryzias latipes TaxID=8090 RepID=UPI000CE21321|nr:aprataxin and PNK-like factor isoform X2 [Oryzias latipes]
MSGFLLVPVDGGNPVPVPPGETLLGRGPLLTISDKRVSRRHGLLQNLDGELRLKPTHANPCFIQASLSSEPRPLPQGSWYTLRDGELLSLLPGRLVFRVEAVGSRSIRSAEEEEQLPASGEGQEGPAGEEGAESDGRSRQTNMEDQRHAALSEVRVRTLPAWMMAAAVQTPALMLKVQSTLQRRKRPAGGVQATPTSKEEEEQRKRKMNAEEEKAPETDVPAGASALSWREPTRPQVEKAPRRLAVNADDPGGPPTNRTQEERDTSVLAPPRATPTTQRRMPCPYGKDCYRKNPLHRREFKHTRKPARSTRAVPRNPPDEEEDEDSFIDDDSEDPDNDSDYNPAPSDDSDGEDIKRLQREATGFLKRRK